MKKITKILASVLVTLTLGTLVFTSVASACDDAADKQAEHFQAVQESVEAGDYDAWQELMSQRGKNAKHSKMLEVITEDNFDLLADLMEAKENKDPEAAKEILEELGLTPPAHLQDAIENRGERQGFGGGKHFRK